MFESQFKFYSMGVAAANKERNSMLLEVTPLEITSMLDGEIIPNFTDIEDKGVDGRGQEYNVKVSTSNSIEATWMQWGSNRRTAPDVRRGEPIILMRYADSDVFYWMCPGLKDELRRLETVVFAISNTRDESVKVLNDKNSYFMEWSTHDKHVTLKTSMSDGEPFAYTVQINTKDGVIVIDDGDDNYFMLESKERRWTLTNKDKTILKLDKKNAYLNAPNLISSECTDYKIQCKTYDLKCETGKITASTKFTIETPDLDLLASTKALIQTPILTIDNGGTAGTTTIKGKVVIEETLIVMKLATFAAGFVMLPTGGVGAPVMSASGSGVSMKIPQTFTDGAGMAITGGGTITHDGVDVGKAHTHPVPALGTSGGVTP